MSGLARTLNQVLKKELNTYVAWFPVTNPFKIGDYGLFEGGVFRAVGNIVDDYPNIDLKIEPGSLANIDFVSSGTNMIKLGAHGEIPSFAQLGGDIDAELKIKFEKANSCIVKAKLTSSHLKNISKVATKLATQPHWKKRYKVVSSIYIGEQCVIISSRDASTELTLSGKANVLQQVGGGKVDGNVGITSSRNSVFHSVGQSGVIGLNFFKVSWLGDLKFLDEISPDDLDIIINPEGLYDDFDS